ncbi:MAG: DUF4912 domain-containing protein [Clostridia bacterium]|nr:DUF4912 domain-containing protein [Clostridia bacterium]
MPRKSKENEELKDTKTNTKTKTSISKKSQVKKEASSTSKSTKTSKKVTTTTKSKTTVSKKESAENTSTKAPKKTSSTKKKTQQKNTIIEYYDLPQKYNQTMVKILAQTPKTLFIYWEISDDDMSKYKEQYGENFFETTKPVLIIHNDTLNYSFEVEINDFANSWYLHVNDSKSNYSVELGRRPFIKNENIKSDYIHIFSSNKIESPNDHILFDNSQKMVYFKNVKTNQQIEKPVSTLFFMKNMGKFYHIYDLYKELYKNEDNLDLLSNPSSHT